MTKHIAVLYKVENQIATITMNRPEVKNALSKAMLNELYQSFENAQNDDLVKVIVLQGSQNAFSAGADLKSIPLEELETFDYGTFLEEQYNRLIRLIVSTEKPVLAYINGIAVGAGLSLALACDYRIATEDAKMGLGFLKIGLVPDAGASYFLPRLVGLSNSMELALGTIISAEKAERMNLINQIGDPAPFITSLTHLPPTAFSLMKQNFRQSFEHNLDDMLQMEVNAQRQAGETKEHKAAILQFLKK
ncbi:enoyl-CoA hydratase/isomerase family protein [Alkalihalobacillus sp. MEB130]|uniref:enoyl-CoA hydratase/isomerase family protein n=1 Tax=Alkalihalobacillus sp. MEB130 TaxID=2976704 RepID=UPI0028DD8412|nr:enoyl-CoA hydratase/isomerase family protein [Alkalihalobacillus sp. MEB130]MDT8861893.1 enoyl-CoA hydratase/isomerase family protein [Alkalihalobacillus sp. MEB130]